MSLTSQLNVNQNKDIITAIDVGIKNLAYVSLDMSNNNINEWKCINLIGKTCTLCDNDATFNSYKGFICNVHRNDILPHKTQLLWNTEDVIKHKCDLCKSKAFIKNRSNYLCKSHKKKFDIDPVKTYKIKPFKINASAAKIDVIADSLFETLNDLKISWIKSDFIIIERQVSSKMIGISMMIYSYFKLNNKNVKFVDASSKFRLGKIFTKDFIGDVVTNTNNGRNNKKTCVDLCSKYLEQHLINNMRWRKMFNDIKKKDDIVDALFLAFAESKNIRQCDPIEPNI